MFFVAKAVGVLLTPPAIIVIVALLGLLLELRWRRLGMSLVVASIVALSLFSMSVTGDYLMAALEDDVAPLAKVDASLRKQVGAIVVLGGGRDRAAVEYGGETVSSLTLERLRYAVRLHRATGLPLLLTGGSPYGESTSEAALMQQALADFKVRATWLEHRSRNTHENAAYSRPLLEAAGVRRVLVVTHASHMPRALWSFRTVGIDAIAAPMGFQGATVEGFSWLAVLPSAHGLSLSNRALQERLGLLWYRLRYSEPPAPADAG